MRKEIYLALIEAIQIADIGIQHISLWNENTIDLEAESGYALPAIFVEFEPIEWQQMGGRGRNKEMHINLHVVWDSLAEPSADSIYQQDALAVFDLLDDVVAVATTISGEYFSRWVHIGSDTDHNHAQVQHHIERFVCRTNSPVYLHGAPLNKVLLKIKK